MRNHGSGVAMRTMGKEGRGDVGKPKLVLFSNVLVCQFIAFFVEVQFFVLERATIAN